MHFIVKTKWNVKVTVKSGKKIVNRHNFRTDKSEYLQDVLRTVASILEGENDKPLAYIIEVNPMEE